MSNYRIQSLDSELALCVDPGTQHWEWSLDHNYQFCSQIDLADSRVKKFGEGLLGKQVSVTCMYPGARLGNRGTLTVSSLEDWKHLLEKILEWAFPEGRDYIAPQEEDVE